MKLLGPLGPIPVKKKKKKQQHRIGHEKTKGFGKYTPTLSQASVTRFYQRSWNS
jgi:hypothetical protein